MKVVRSAALGRSAAVEQVLPGGRLREGMGPEQRRFLSLLLTGLLAAAALLGLAYVIVSLF